MTSPRLLLRRLLGSGLVDDRPSAPDSWKFRARNPLLFPPELSETRDICRVRLCVCVMYSMARNVWGGGRLACVSLRLCLPAVFAWWELTGDTYTCMCMGNAECGRASQVDPEAATRRLLLTTASSDRTSHGRPPKARKVTVYANSRFPSASSRSDKVNGVGTLQCLSLLPTVFVLSLALALQACDAVNKQTGALQTGFVVGDSTAASRDEFELVQMTPLLEPGVDATPIMTWGEIEGTPMILDARATAGASPRTHEHSNSTMVRRRVESRQHGLTRWLV